MPPQVAPPYRPPTHMFAHVCTQHTCSHVTHTHTIPATLALSRTCNTPAHSKSRWHPAAAGGPALPTACYPSLSGRWTGPAPRLCSGAAVDWCLEPFLCVSRVSPVCAQGLCFMCAQGLPSVCPGAALCVCGFRASPLCVPGATLQFQSTVSEHSFRARRGQRPSIVSAPECWILRAPCMPLSSPRRVSEPVDAHACAEKPSRMRGRRRLCCQTC